jgi:Tol biopolymer transport system component
MLTRADRILSELLLSKGIVAQDALERCARARESGAREQSLAESLVEDGALDPLEVERFEQEARSIDHALIPTLPGGGRLGEFRILREIGRGGMGIVFEAHQEGLDRRVALKILPAGAALDEKLSIRFLREARAAARLDHPGIVRVMSSGISEGVLFFTMELIEGRSLAELIDEGPLTPDRAAALAAEIARALAHAHASGLVHRDIKPENVLLGADGRARITDFGLVHEHSALPVTVSHFIVGTPSYMAPEQALGKEVDARSDVYSLGAVLYAMLAGHPPYRGEVPALVISRVLTEPYAPLATVRPDVPEGLAAICQRALAREPANRYSSAEAMAEDLERHLRGLSPVALRSFSPGAAAAPQVQRPAAAPGHRLTMGIALAGVLAAATVAGTLWHLRSGNPETQPGAASPPVIEGVFTPLHAAPGHKSRISVFRDGHRLLWAGDVAGKQDIFAQEIQTGRVVNLTSGSFDEVFNPAVSPDGDTIAFFSLRKPGGLFLMPSKGGKGRAIETVTDWSPASWSSDGRFLLLCNKTGSSVRGVVSYYGRMAVISVPDGRTVLQPGRDAGDPTWSPDGRRIVFLSQTGGQSDIWTMTAQGLAPSRVTDDSAEEWSPRYSPDGRYLYLGSDRAGAMALWRLPINQETGVAAGPAEQVTRSIFASPFDVAVAPDGRELFLLAQSSQQTLHALTFDPRALSVAGSPAWIAREFVNVGSADITGDGKRLVMAVGTMGTSQSNLVTARLDGSGRSTLTEGPFRDESPHWSPDGSRIAFQSDRGGRMEIWSVRPDGSDVVRVSSVPDGDSIAPVWSPDGARLAFAVVGGSAFVVTMKDGRPAGDPEPLPSADPSGSSFEPSSWSGDGREIAGTADGIVIYSPVQRRFRRLTGSGRHPIWLPGWRELLFTDGASLRVLDTRTGEDREIFSAAPNGISPNLSLAPDGRTVYVCLTSSDETIFKLTLGTAEASDQGVK